MVRRSLQRLAFALSLPILVATMATVAPAQSCDPETDVTVQGDFHFVGNTVSAQFCNTGACAQAIGLATYEKFGDAIANQILFDSQTTILGAGECTTLTVSFPPCFYQVDAFYGDLITTFANGDLYGTRLLKGNMLGTTACVEEGGGVTGCTFTFGYWKNHPGAWPTDSLALGTNVYTKNQLLSILREPVRGNGLVSLAHQLIAAKLNQLNGASVPSDVQDAINGADSLIGSLIVPPLPGAGFLDPSVTSAFNDTLDQYNNGLAAGGPPHCD